MLFYWPVVVEILSDNVRVCSVLLCVVTGAKQLQVIILTFLFFPPKKYFLCLIRNMDFWLGVK